MSRLNSEANSVRNAAVQRTGACGLRLRDGRSSRRSYRVSSEVDADRAANLRRFSEFGGSLVHEKEPLHADQRCWTHGASPFRADPSTSDFYADRDRTMTRRYRSSRSLRSTRAVAMVGLAAMLWVVVIGRAQRPGMQLMTRALFVFGRTNMEDGGNAA